METTQKKVYSRYGGCNLSLIGAFLRGDDIATVECGLSKKELQQRFMVLTRLTEFDMEPTRSEFIKISNEFVIPSKIVIISWKVLIEAGFKPGQKVYRPVIPKTCKVKPNDIKTCSRLAYLKVGD